MRWNLLCWQGQSPRAVPIHWGRETRTIHLPTNRKLSSRPGSTIKGQAEDHGRMVRAGKGRFEGQRLYEQHLKLGRSGDGETPYRPKNLSVEGGEAPDTMCLETERLYGAAGSHGEAVWNQTGAGVCLLGLPRA